VSLLRPQALQKLGIDLSVGELTKYVDKFDVNGDGELDFSVRFAKKRMDVTRDVAWGLAS
jgi:Ca2+-binding EF-hand superfamily protein